MKPCFRKLIAPLEAYPLRDEMGESPGNVFDHDEDRLPGSVVLLAFVDFGVASQKKDYFAM